MPPVSTGTYDFAQKLQSLPSSLWVYTLTLAHHCQYSHCLISYPLQFLLQVNSEEYHRVITKPMDLSLIKVKIDNRKKYKLQELDADFKVMFNNCFLFNESYSGVYQVKYVY